ncbi:MAG: hypothetical protein K1X74_13510 [Pirellulales bacterium]|nr:hypothetical protein [Pirellulales bacterium]
MKLRNLLFAVTLAAYSVMNGSVQQLAAATVSLPAPKVNRWMYPFGPPVGNRPSAATFSAIGDPSFDERDAEFLLGFDTAAGGVPSGAGAANYLINSITLELTVQDPNGQGGSTFVYDPTYDSYTTFGAGVDGDAGRPVEVYALGFRNGYDDLGLSGPANTVPHWTVNSLFTGVPGAPAPLRRSALPLGSTGGAALVDVSNNLGTNGVGAGFDPVPLGVGTAALSPGAAVPDGTKMTFALNLSDALYLEYLRASLDRGVLGLAVTSLHAASFGGPVSYPVWDTIDAPGGVAPRLVIDYTIVPEPSAMVLALVGAALALGRQVTARRGRKA